MSIRGKIATFGMRRAQGFWSKVTGTELVVETSDHSIEISMEKPGPSDGRAWDPHLFKKGQLFVKGYANPIKPSVETNHELGESDEITIEEGQGEIEEEEEEAHVEIISSGRYRQYMNQELISQLLNPREQWKIVVYAVIALAFMMLINLVVTLQISGAFG